MEGLDLQGRGQGSRHHTGVVPNLGRRKQASYCPKPQLPRLTESTVFTQATKGERLLQGAIWSFYIFFTDGSFLMDLRLRKLSSQLIFISLTVHLWCTEAACSLRAGSPRAAPGRAIKLLHTPAGLTAPQLVSKPFPLLLPCFRPVPSIPGAVSPSPRFWGTSGSTMDGARGSPAHKAMGFPGWVFARREVK